jgi:hypothetical protein
VDFNAEYLGLSSSPYGFIQEYVEYDNNAKQEARQPTPIQLDLKLQGALLKPDITFDMAFPKLAGSLKTYTDSKLRLLRQEANEMNRQVFGLIVAGVFIPSDASLLSPSQLGTGAINTATELLSSMFNRFLSEYVTGLDIQIGYNILQYDKFTINDIARADHQFRLRGSKSFYDDRVTVGGGIGLERGFTVSDGNNGGTFFGYDIFLDYALTNDRRLKLRVSQTQDQVIDGVRQKPAIGLRFRQEFDNLDELLRAFGLRK